MADLAEQVKKAGTAFGELAAKVAQLERDLKHSEECRMATAVARDHAEQMLAECRDAEQVYDDLDDLRRGVLTSAELFERHLDYDPIAA